MAEAGAQFGRYELRGELGRGGFATVFRAWDVALGREVALKALQAHLAIDATIRQRFMAEARAIAQLHHPNIITVHEVDEANGRPFFTMELINGPTLASLVAPGQGLPLGRVAEIMRGLASAVDYLHTRRLVHRDIKASNVMLDAWGRVVLMDFGVARALDQTQLTQSGISIGTPEAMAPEQVRGQPAGPAADIYALGVLAYRLLAGRAPFVGETIYVLHAHAYEPPPALSELRPGLP
ncbi:MAG TPA: serine/threonine-protein kinase, partial [Dehalococcoidia bacterium]|nr:serine/threonine-protein kinase [Dehalococcoidia bacterium]